MSGGDTRLGTWNQVKADVLGIPVVRVPGDAATTGIAMLAGIGTGVYPTVEAAIERCVHLEDRIEPRRQLGARYDEAYAEYCGLAEATVVRREPR